MISKVFNFSLKLSYSAACGCLCQCEGNGESYRKGYNNGTGYGAKIRI